MSESTKLNVTTQQQRRLSIVEDQSVVSGELNGKKTTYLAPPNAKSQSLQLPPQTPDNRKSSKWNVPRASVFVRRFSHSMSYSSRRSSENLAFQSRVKYQNTYRLAPDENTKFYGYKVEPKIYAALEHTLKGRAYDPAKCALLSKELSEKILHEIRNLISQRYKLVLHVSIGQNLNQDIRCASRCLWDANYDSYVSVNYKTNNLFAVATLFAVYFE